MRTIWINHEKYGQTTEFKTLKEAERVIRKCGPEFKYTSFRVFGVEIYDQDRDLVGEIKDLKKMTREMEG